jgi:aryl-alcohol dehydrogenase-like predicted oxidoreductase
VRIDRRTFVKAVAAAGAGAAVVPGSLDAPLFAQSFVARKKSAVDRVKLGHTGIEVSRVAMGSGTRGWMHQSDQTRMGPTQLTTLLRYGFDHGLTFWEAADQYGSHPFLAAALKGVDRSKVTILSKTTARDAVGIARDVERFRRELQTDYIDILLLHAVTDADWTQHMKGAMDALSEAKQKKLIRAHGLSCHSIRALRAAAEAPWVDVGLSRINPAGIAMDEKPSVVIPVLEKMKGAGKGVLGMKIFGQGELSDEPDRALRHAAQLECLDAFTIGFMSSKQVDDVIRRVPVLAQAAV